MNQATVEVRGLKASGRHGASAGEKDSCLIHPDQLGAFILAHSQARWVFHNVAFDFWVVNRHLSGRGEEEALRAWWADQPESVSPPP